MKPSYQGSLHSNAIISGADGSGKTTAVRLLTSYFSGFGEVCIHWFRGSHLFASVLARFLHDFSSFRGSCNPYYKICIPERLKAIWVFLEFVSLIPHLFTRFLLRKVCKFLVCDRGLLDFVVWLIATLDAPWLLRSIYGNFLLRLISKERVVYLYAEPDKLNMRADVPRSFLIKELAIYNVLAKYVAQCSIDTGVNKPIEVFKGVLMCLENRTP